MILEIITNTVTGSEPTTLVAAETWFRSEDSDGIEDSLITSLLKQAREAVEKVTNLSLVARTMEVYLDEWIGYLPLGPIVPASLTIVSGEASTKGLKYPYVTESEAATVTYTCTAFVNEDLKNAIYELASFWYFRGDMNDRSIPEKVRLVLKRHSRNVFL